MRARRTAAVLGLALVVSAGTGCSAKHTSGSPTATTSLSTGGTGTGATCHWRPSPRDTGKSVGTPPATVEPHTTLVAHLSTSIGDITFRMSTAKTPCTATSFAFLAAKHYFDGTSCHRLTTAGIHVLQCGDPTGTGLGGPGYSFTDEALDAATYPTGTVAMANGGPNTNGSQFFLVYGDTPLGPSYTPFGTITAGLDLIQKAAVAGSDEANGPGDGHPKTKVEIRSFTVTPA